MSKTVGFATSLVLVAILTGCFLSAERRAEMTRATERPTLEAAATALVQANALATAEASKKATAEALEASGELRQLVIGNWTARTPITKYSYFYIEFYPDGTYATRPWPLTTVEEHMRGQIITGTYEVPSTDQLKMKDNLAGEQVYELSLEQKLITETGEIRHYMNLGPIREGNEFLPGYVRCEGALINHPERPDPFCVGGLRWELEKYQPIATERAVQRAAIEASMSSGDLRSALLGEWAGGHGTLTLFGASNVINWIGFYPDDTFFAKELALTENSVVTYTGNVIRGSYKILSTSKIRLSVDEKEVECKVSFVGFEVVIDAQEQNQGISRFYRCLEGDEHCENAFSEQ